MQYVSINVIEAANTILAPFDKVLQDAAIKQFDEKMKVKCPLAAQLLPKGKKITQLLLNKKVKEVNENANILDSGEVVPYGMAVWAGKAFIAIIMESKMCRTAL